MTNVRQARPSDIPIYAQIQDEEWGDQMSADEEKLAHRLTVFPEGMLVAESDGHPAGFLSIIRLTAYDHREQTSWTDTTGDGWGHTHDPTGPVMFGVDLSVSRRAPRTTTAQLFMAGLGLTMRVRAGAIYWGGRMPRYHKHCGNYSPTEYLTARNKRGRRLDPEIELYSRVPGVEILGVIPNYFKDWESLDYGVALRWTNPIVRYPFLRPLSDHIPRYLYWRQAKKAKGVRQ